MRKLSLRAERLHELGAADLAAVAGGVRTWHDCVIASVLEGACEFPTYGCFTGSYTYRCPTEAVD